MKDTEKLHNSDDDDEEEDSDSDNNGVIKNEDLIVSCHSDSPVSIRARPSNLAEVSGQGALHRLPGRRATTTKGVLPISR